MLLHRHTPSISITGVFMQWLLSTLIIATLHDARSLEITEGELCWWRTIYFYLISHNSVAAASLGPIWMVINVGDGLQLLWNNLLQRGDYNYKGEGALPEPFSVQLPDLWFLLVGSLIILLLPDSCYPLAPRTLILWPPSSLISLPHSSLIPEVPISTTTLPISPQLYLVSVSVYLIHD